MTTTSIGNKIALNFIVKKIAVKMMTAKIIGHRKRTYIIIKDRKFFVVQSLITIKISMAYLGAGRLLRMSGTFLAAVAGAVAGAEAAAADGA